MAEKKHGQEEYAMSKKGVDEFLAGAGYNVRPSDLRQVAHKLEQLEMALNGTQDSGISHLTTETVHYNPSDLGGWIDSMLNDLSEDQQQSGGESTLVSETAETENNNFLGFELAEAAGFLDPDQNSGGLFELLGSASTDEDGDEENNNNPSRDLVETSAEESQTESSQKRRNINDCDNNYNNNGVEEDYVLNDDPTEECATSGVRLVHALMACGDAIQRSNLYGAEEMLKNVKTFASTTGGAMAKVAQYFSQAIIRRIYGFSTQDPMYIENNDSLSELLDIHFYETCPYLKFAHFTANQAILEAFQGHKRVHVIDFSLKQGVQWPALIQALALRPGGPPALRLTGIGPPQPDGKDFLHDVGIKLAQLADSVNVEFDFRGYVASNLSDIKPWILDVRPGEAIAVNSIFQLHSLLFTPDHHHHHQNPLPIEEVLFSVRALNPKIMTLVEQEACHNSPVFLERFTEALHYYSTMFDSLEARRLPAQSYQQLMSEMYLARSICNIVACEGAERVERHENLMTWRLRMQNAGFRPLHLGSNAFKQASMLLTLFSGGEGYRVEENNGCLTLGWHTRPLIAVSAWQCC